MQLVMLATLALGLAAEPSDELSLFKLPEGTAGGRCNDGSPAAWYYGAPQNETVSDWVIWLMGGGACNTAQKCAHRSKYKKQLTSSTHLKPTKLVGSKESGTSSSKYILSDDPKLNPDFFHAHKVRAHLYHRSPFTYVIASSLLLPHAGVRVLL